MTVSVEYLAGIIDGEGSIMLVRTGNAQFEGLYTSWTIKMQIANTNLELLNVLQANFGGVIKRTTKGGKNWKQGYRLEWFGSNAADLCLRVFEHLIVKKEQASIAMKAMTVRNREGGKGRRKSPETVLFLNEASAQIKALNRRGVAA